MARKTMAEPGFEIISIDPHNLEQFGFFCIKNKKHPGYAAKLDWLKKRFTEGLRLKLVVTDDGKTAGFLEYIPGELTWRVVNASEHMVIHCLWVASNKFPYRGMAKALLDHCLDDATRSHLSGVTVVTSEGPWMAGKAVYEKYGFKKVDQAEPHFGLLFRPGQKTVVKHKHAVPSFPSDWVERRKRLRGLQLLYSDQCPFITKAVNELPPVAQQHGIHLRLKHFRTPARARQQMPSPYGTVCLTHRGKILADHPVSATRFRNILQKELNLRRNQEEKRESRL
jgi:N-acetylglutamate synthase-like GNAT family acetyltransferase